MYIVTHLTDIYSFNTLCLGPVPKPGVPAPDPVRDSSLGEEVVSVHVYLTWQRIINIGKALILGLPQ